MSFNWSEFVPERMRKGTPYVPGEQKNTRDWVKLNTNEFPYPPSPAVPEAIMQACGDIRYYPNPTGVVLREALAKHHSVDASSVVVFNGCDDALNCCIRGFVEPGELVASLNPSYSLYGTLVRNHGAEVVGIEYGEGFEFPLDGLRNCTAKMFILTSPNAPSGRAFEKEELVALLESKDAVIVVDETYADFSDWTAIPLIEEYENLIVVRSFSKTYGLAGLRIGYAVASCEAVKVFHQIRDVYNTNRLSQAAAVAALEDREYYQEKHRELIFTREQFADFLQNQMGWRCYPSSTNFLFCFPRKQGAVVESVEAAKSLFDFLVENRVLVRYFSSHKLVESGLRVSIGAPQEMEKVKSLFEKWAKKE